MPETLDIVFRTVAVTVAVLLAGLLVAARRHRAAAIPGALFCLAVAAFFLTSTPGGGAVPGVLGVALTALCVTKAAWFWLFARALFRDDARLGSRHLAIVGAVAVVGTWQQLAFLPAFRTGTASSLETVIGFGFEAGLLVLVLLGLYEAGRGIAVDLVERRRRLRVGFLAATAVYLTVTLGVQSYNLLLGVSTPGIIALANMLLAAAACLGAAWFLLQPRSDSWLDPAKPVKVAALNRLESAVLASLNKALESDRVFLQEGLTIGELAGHLGTGEQVLRNVINRGMGYRNFNDFLHTWRIREACGRLTRPECARESVLAIAMSVGYGSIGPFNRAFKARTGMTPTDYRRKNSEGAANSAQKAA